MYICYFDESGDSGYQNSPTTAFSLGCLIVDEEDWLHTLDEIVLLRGDLRRRFHIPSRSEIKANWLIHGSHTFQNLNISPTTRKAIYREIMEFQDNIGTTQTFGVVINKDNVIRQDVDPRFWAWQRAIERLSTFGRVNGRNLHIIPDEGHSYFIRKLLRRMRRHHQVVGHFGHEILQRNANNIIEDVSERKSEESYFIQLADLNAYAAYRAIHPVTDFDATYWDSLGVSRILEVNQVAGGHPGIVSWPQ